MSIKLLLVALAAVSFASGAHAQDVVVEGDAPIVEQAPADEAIIIPETAPAPACIGARKNDARVTACRVRPGKLVSLGTPDRSYSLLAWHPRTLTFRNRGRRPQQPR